MSILDIVNRFYEWSVSQEGGGHVTPIQIQPGRNMYSEWNPASSYTTADFALYLSRIMRVWEALISGSKCFIPFNYRCHPQTSFSTSPA